MPSRALRCLFLSSVLGIPAVAEPTPEKLDRILSDLKYGDVNLRLAAASSLYRYSITGDLGGRDISKELLLAMADPTLAVRRAAAEGLAYAGGNDSNVSAIARLLRSNPSESFRHAATFFLGEKKCISSTILLLDLMDDPSPDVKQGAAVSIGRLAILPNRAIPKLMELLREEYGPIREAALIGLYGFGHRAASVADDLAAGLLEGRLSAFGIRTFVEICSDQDYRRDVLTEIEADGPPALRSAAKDALVASNP